MMPGGWTCNVVSLMTALKTTTYFADSAWFRHEPIAGEFGWSKESAKPCDFRT